MAKKQNQRELHGKTLKALGDLEKLIDQLKLAGPHEHDGWNALMNTQEHLSGLAQRCHLAGGWGPD